ncbi:precorrin-8X methylmutase [Algoriphagus algorifonticola]|uniref:precorrin-8X methylmutase n=1 Tax=Algoriphagus algorifonticola TaxID=2593007 RepID=UPI00119D1743|nr:precorrin-8X methylmutase [Algoriphagus algorifonticola]
MDQIINSESFELIRKELNLSDQVVSLSEEEYLKIISKAIHEMLNRDFERLLQVCYRIDLGEEKLKKILNESDPDHLALDLAHALWTRQKQKVEIRRRYS